jgi:hypothetical protein
MSLGPLEGLETVRDKVLGKWEFAQELDVREAAIFVHPGIYSFYDHKGKPQTKTRGFKIDLLPAPDCLYAEDGSSTFFSRSSVVLYCSKITVSSAVDSSRRKFLFRLPAHTRQVHNNRRIGGTNVILIDRV